ncbi:MAG: hypothetical protein WD118_00380 [Phycisphaeraceae bacterium]
MARWKFVTQSIDFLLGEKSVTLLDSLQHNRRRDLPGSEIDDRKYRVSEIEDTIIIERVNLWGSLAGFPPLYYFKGRVQKRDDSRLVEGRILMRSIPRYFILLWIFLIAVSFLIGMGWSMWLAINFMVTQSTSLLNDLSTAGFFGGATLAIAAFGALIISLVRGIATSQRNALIRFCEARYVSH